MLLKLSRVKERATDAGWKELLHAADVTTILISPNCETSSYMMTILVKDCIQLHAYQYECEDDMHQYQLTMCTLYTVEQTWQRHWASCHQTVQLTEHLATCKQTDLDQGHT